MYRYSQQVRQNLSNSRARARVLAVLLVLSLAGCIYFGIAYSRERSYHATAQQAGSTGKVHPKGPLHEIQDVARCPATEAMEPPAAIKDGEAGGSIGMEWAARHPFLAGWAKGNDLCGNGGQGISAADRVHIDHGAPPPNARAAIIAAHSGRTAWAMVRNCT